jgi:endonuclease YncB( thermonuclease family)
MSPAGVLLRERLWLHPDRLAVARRCSRWMRGTVLSKTREFAVRRIAMCTGRSLFLIGRDGGKVLLETFVRALPGSVVASLGLSATVAFAGDVYDGDTIEIQGQRARLYGIDAFELSQTCLDARGRPWRCGIAAKAALAERLEGQALQCVVLDESQDGWYIARCEGEDGTDLSAYMVRSGLALADTDDYLAEQADARRRGAGAWEGAFMPPWQWRSDGR